MCVNSLSILLFVAWPHISEVSHAKKVSRTIDILIRYGESRKEMGRRRREESMREMRERREVRK